MDNARFFKILKNVILKSVLLRERERDRFKKKKAFSKRREYHGDQIHTTESELQMCIEEIVGDRG